MKDFVGKILQEHFEDKSTEIFSHSQLLQYLDSKMGAIYGDSKTRRSLANIYAIYSLINFYIIDFFNDKERYKEFSGYDYMRLFNFYRSLYGGSKLQNHALNSRVNGEFENKFNIQDKPLIVIENGKYALHIDFLYVNNIDISKCVKVLIERYVELLQAKDSQLIADIEELRTLSDSNKQKKKIISMLDEKSEARIFEIISFVILKNHYKNTKIYIGFSADSIKEEYLKLYKTGRTNANDGGIDFVMRPLGRFFQVTEVGNYDKYTLDMDKVMHFPITFVVKTDKNKEALKSELLQYIEVKSGGMKIIKSRYINAIEELITINELKKWLFDLSSDDMLGLLKDIEIYYKLELNID